MAGPDGGTGTARAARQREAPADVPRTEIAGAPPAEITSAPPARRRLMAVSSGGGHWIELRRILPAFEGLEVVYVSTDPGPDGDLGPVRYHRIVNVTRRNGHDLPRVVWQLARLVRAERPAVVVTTGAAPGLVALVLAKLLVGSRTVWIDSIAAAEGMSLSGRLARPVADAWLTQWPHLARPGGPEHWGAVL